MSDFSSYGKTKILRFLTDLEGAGAIALRTAFFIDDSGAEFHAD